MTTRALEDSEIKAIFEHVSGYNAKRNETILIVPKGKLNFTCYPGSRVDT
jgi:hypothetical protein